MNSFRKYKNSIVAFVVLVVIAAAVFVVVTRLWEFRSLSTGSGGGVPAAGKAPEKQWVWIFYANSVDLAEYGDFSFEYPSRLAIKSDSVKTVGGEKRHVVALVRRGEVNATTTVADTIEINAKGGEDPCASYRVCKAIDGVAVGTNSKNQEFLSLYSETVGKFKVMPKIEKTKGPPSCFLGARKDSNRGTCGAL